METGDRQVSDLVYSDWRPNQIDPSTVPHLFRNTTVITKYTTKKALHMPQQSNVPNRRGKPPAMLRCEKLIEITVADNPSAWTSAGFKVHQHPMPHRDPFVQVGQVTINLIGGHGGIVSWAFESSPAHNAEMGFIVDGLATTLVSARDEERHDLMKPFLASIQSTPFNNPNGVTGLDHIVIGSKNASRTIGMLAMLGIHPRAPALERNGKRYWFFKSGDVVIELIEKTSSASSTATATATAATTTANAPNTANEKTDR
ncbi:hypothetical protein BJ741DRAFT_606946 [Chytriomyces cf. hyalinus JEL632]|nr:hypothetical protein BJ741DRAFT_606946 [Chytriomyces cf. hyalinus JEL632]